MEGSSRQKIQELWRDQNCMCREKERTSMSQVCASTVMSAVGRVSQADEWEEQSFETKQTWVQILDFLNFKSSSSSNIYPLQNV